MNYNNKTMKTFTTAEIRDLLNRVYREEISFSHMVEILNRRVSERVSESADIPEGLKEGDLAIFWDSNKEKAAIGIYKQFHMGAFFPHEDHSEAGWQNAIKFESKEQFEKLIKEEI